jgi:hypothetical protein
MRMRQIGLAILVLFCVSASACEERAEIAKAAPPAALNGDGGSSAVIPRRTDATERWNVLEIRSNSCAVRSSGACPPSAYASCSRSEFEPLTCLAIVSRPSVGKFSHYFTGGNNNDAVKCSLALPGDTLVVTVTMLPINKEDDDGNKQYSLGEPTYAVQSVESGAIGP